ncbi:MAG: hypothetical protein U0105_13970 [Candidatus Obscuribacterales bacterium]
MKNTDSLRKGLSELFFGADGSVDRVWSKLTPLWETWKEQSADALAKVNRLGVYVTRHEDSAATWQARAEDYAAREDHADMVVQCETKRQHFLQSAAELKEEQTRFKEKLTQTWDLYCRTEALITRLYLQKIMMRALPKSTKERSTTFVEVALGMQDLLKQVTGGSAQADQPTDSPSTAAMRSDLQVLTDKLETLESSVLEAYQQVLTDKGELEAESPLSAYLERLGSAVNELETVSVAKGGTGEALDERMAEERQAFLDDALDRVDGAFKLLALTATYLRKQQ